MAAHTFIKNFVMSINERYESMVNQDVNWDDPSTIDVHAWNRICAGDLFSIAAMRKANDEVYKSCMDAVSDEPYGLVMCLYREKDGRFHCDELNRLKTEASEFSSERPEASAFCGLTHCFKSDRDTSLQMALTFVQWNALVDCCDRFTSKNMALSADLDWIEPFKNYDLWFADDQWSRCEDGRNTTITKSMAKAMSEVLRVMIHFADHGSEETMADYVGRSKNSGQLSVQITLEQIKRAASQFIEFEREAESDIAVFVFGLSE